MGLLDALFGTKRTYKELGVEELDSVPPHVIFIDVREPSEYTGELGHLPRAKSVPLGSLKTTAEAWDKNASYLMICRSGGRSANACSMLTSMGFGDVTNLRGGMLAVKAR